MFSRIRADLRIAPSSWFSSYFALYLLKINCSWKLHCICKSKTHIIWAEAQYFQQACICTEWRLKSAFTFVQADQASMFVSRCFGSLTTHSCIFVGYATAPLILNIQFLQTSFQDAFFQSKGTDIFFISPPKKHIVGTHWKCLVKAIPVRSQYISVE